MSFSCAAWVLAFLVFGGGGSVSMSGIMNIHHPLADELATI
jgi:hypothetical protein